MGFFVDLFNIYLPIVVLAPAIIYFVSPELGETGTALVGAPSLPQRLSADRSGP